MMVMMRGLKLDWRTITFVSLSQFAPWLAIVLVVTWAGYPGVVCVTPLAWLIALRVGLVCLSKSSSSEQAQRLLQAAMAGALFGLLQGLLFWVVVPRMGPILPGEQGNANGLIVVMLVAGTAAGAGLALLAAYLRERRVLDEARGM